MSQSIQLLFMHGFFAHKHFSPTKNTIHWRSVEKIFTETFKRLILRDLPSPMRVKLKPYTLFETIKVVSLPTFALDNLLQLGKNVTPYFWNTSKTEGVVKNWQIFLSSNETILQIFIKQFYWTKIIKVLKLFINMMKLFLSVYW